MKSLTITAVLTVIILQFGLVQNAIAANINNGSFDMPAGIEYAHMYDSNELNPLNPLTGNFFATPPITATYSITFEATWSQATHPHPDGAGSFPSNPHFSRLIGGVHNSDVIFWQVGATATVGIERMAEEGRAAPLKTEVNAAIADAPPTTLAVLGGTSGTNIATSPGSTTINSFSVTQDFPLVTLVSMLAPSSDWFVGVSGLPLFENGDWAPDKVVDLYPYDAGTEEGDDYSGNNSATNPPVNITNISGMLPFSSAPVGTFTFTRIDYSALDISKAVTPTANVSSHSLVTYTIVLSNSGDTDATGTFLTDTLPISTTFAKWIDQPSGASDSEDYISWTGNITANDAITFTFVVTYSGTAYGNSITNTAYYAHTSGSGQAKANFTVQDTPVVLTISKNGPITVASGMPITYTLTVTNKGASTATNLVITDTIPAGATYLAGGTKVGDVVSWTVASLPVSNTTQVSFAITATQTITNNNYRVSATDGYSAVGQITVVTSVSDTQPVVISPAVVALSGVVSGTTGVTYSFTANINPITATQPITYQWQADNQLMVTHSNGLSDTVSFAWPGTGQKFITVTAQNDGGIAIDTHSITITDPITDTPVAGLVAFNNSPTELAQATILSATISTGDNVSYSWAFGDGQISSSAIVSHTYPATGTYTAMVTASNAVNLLTATTTITINGTPGDRNTEIYLPLILKNN